MSISLVVINKSGARVAVPEILDVNMNNRNALDVVAALGYSLVNAEPSVVSLQEMWSSCVAFEHSDLRDYIDGEVDLVSTGNVVQCSRERGYIGTRVFGVKTVLEWAMMESDGAFCQFI